MRGSKRVRSAEAAAGAANPKRKRADTSARKTRNKTSRLSTVKIGLAALGASAPMRATIENVTRQTQRIVYEAALLANCTVAHALERGEPVPPVHEQNFWKQCISQCAARGADGKPRRSNS